MIDIVASVTARTLAALSGPVARWVNTKTSTALKREIDSLAVAASESGKRSSDGLWMALRLDADLEPQELSSAHGALTSPLMQSCLQMAVIEAIVQPGQPSTARDQVRLAIATVLSLEAPTLKRGNRAAIASVVEAEYHGEAARIFKKLASKNSRFAHLVLESAASARRTLQLTNTAALGKRLENISTLDVIELAELESSCAKYAEAIVTEFELLSIPTPVKEFQVDIEDAFIPSGLEELVDDGETFEARGPGQGIEASTLLDVLSTRQNVILFGDPGSGKSTNVQLAVLQLAKSVISGSIEAVPIRVVVRDLARVMETASVSVLDYIVSTVNSKYSLQLTQNLLRYLLHSGRAVVFFDGLDEVLDVARRSEASHAVARVANAFPASSFVVTSRLAGYAEAGIPGGDRFTSLKTRSMTEGQVEKYAGWFFDLHGVGPYRQALGVSGFMRQTNVIADIRSNPLMLGVICALYATGRSVPSDRADVYRQCARMLFEQWDQLKEVYTTVVDHDIAEEAIRGLAFNVLRSGREEIRLSDLGEFLSTAYEDELRCSHLVARKKADETIALWRGRRWILVYDGRRDGDEWYRFAHRTFMEYFAAEYQAFSISDGRELFGTLKGLMCSRSAGPFVQLSIQFTSNRRAVDGSLFLESALSFITDESVNAGERLGCAISVAEVMPGLRVKPAADRAEGVVTLVTLIAKWLPRTINMSRFFDTPYAYHDFRDLPQNESVVTRVVGDHEGLDDPGEDGDLSSADWMREAGVTYNRCALVLLALDDGRLGDDGAWSGVLREAVDSAMSRVSNAEATRFALFMRAVPEMEAAGRSSVLWRDLLRAIGNGLLSGLKATRLAPDWEDSWSVVQLASLSVVDLPDAVERLSLNDLVVGGTPFPVVEKFTDGTLAHHASIMLLSGSSRATQLAHAVLDRKDRSVDREYLDLFVPWNHGPLHRAPQIGVECAIAVGLMMHLISSFGDHLFVGSLKSCLSAGDPSHQLALRVFDLYEDRYDESCWSRAIEVARSMGADDDDFHAMVGLRSRNSYR